MISSDSVVLVDKNFCLGRAGQIIEKVLETYRDEVNVMGYGSTKWVPTSDIKATFELHCSGKVPCLVVSFYHGKDYRALYVFLYESLNDNPDKEIGDLLSTYDNKVLLLSLNNWGEYKTILTDMVNAFDSDKKYFRDGYWDHEYLVPLTEIDQGVDV